METVKKSELFVVVVVPVLVSGIFGDVVVPVLETGDIHRSGSTNTGKWDIRWSCCPSA